MVPFSETESLKARILTTDVTPKIETVIRPNIVHEAVSS